MRLVQPPTEPEVHIRCEMALLMLVAKKDPRAGAMALAVVEDILQPDLPLIKKAVKEIVPYLVKRTRRG